MLLKKDFAPTKLLWLDLEMTGLDPEADLILEVAVEVTNMKLETLASYESRIKQPKKTVLERMNKNIWWQDYPHNRDDFLSGLEHAPTISQVESDLIKLIEKHFGSEPVVLAGNSIHNDRLFIRRWLSEFELKLHYRMLDVTSFKIFMQSRFQVYFEKPEAHRAFEDVQASIAELQYYTEFFKSRA